MPEDVQPPPAVASHRVGNHDVPEDWPVTGETAGSFVAKLRSGFYAAYMAGDVILDVGYRGAFDNATPVFPHAIGVDIGSPGYDGSRLPFEDGSVDTVYSSHMLEHVADYVATIRDWYRVLRVGGFIVCVVPHQFLYEKRRHLPSHWNHDHKRFYTPSRLLREFEDALEPNSYRVRHLADGDEGYTYWIGPERHAGGRYEIEVVIEKLDSPRWMLAGSLPDRPGRHHAAIGASAGEIPRRRPVLWRSALSRVARFLSPGRSARVRAEEARAAGQWERAARLYADALIEEPGAAVLWDRFAEMLERVACRNEANRAHRRAAAPRGTAS